jgi:peptidoglycan hydrolase-like protein with peptidoglycan-binding domain
VPPTTTETQKEYPYGKASETSGNIRYGSSGKQVKAIQWALKEMQYNLGPSGIDGKFGSYTQSAVRAFQRDTGTTVDGVVGSKTRDKFRLKEFKSGGLADFTGPAWLDGTKSKPEYILNADQTKAFFNLIDVLEGFNRGNSGNSQISGDNIYDVDINVESIGNDYDVEQLATTVKRLINDDARYRNNNTINISR